MHSQSTSPPRVAARAARRRPLSRDRLTAMLMIAPSVLAIAVFVYGFIGWTGYISLTSWDSITPDYTFVGLQNYGDLLGNRRFLADIRNTVVFTSLFLALNLVLGLALALLVDARPRGEAFFRSVYLFPMALSFIVTGVAWSWLFNPGNFPTDPTGINLLFSQIGLGGLQAAWTTDKGFLPDWYPEWSKINLGVPLAMIPVVVAATWQMSGFTMAMYLAGLRGIPEEVREAARVDGANDWQLFRDITLPLLTPITVSVVVILGHISLKIFDLIITMTGGQPGNNTDVPGLFMYDITFNANKIAQGAAVAVVMLVLVALLIVPYLISSARAEAES